MIKNYQLSRGVALYLSIVVGSIVIAVGLGLANIFLREIKISRTLFPSLVAYYAADTGSECALYWDLQNGWFTGSSPANIACKGSASDIIVSHASIGTADVYTFSFELTSVVQNACVDVEVIKDTIAGSPCTRINSYGRSINCGGGGAVIAVERGVVVRDPESCAI